jgi:DNA-directed RNA polymerase subunit RPC12/RpoP
MIHFSCPSCRNSLMSPDEAAGTKIACPKCGQRLLIPPPVQAQNKTVLGISVPEPISPNLPPQATQNQFTCPQCNAQVLVSEEYVGRMVECPNCRIVFAALLDDGVPSSGSLAERGYLAPVRRQTIHDLGTAQLDIRFFGDYPRKREHSGLGIASFLIALLVGGIDLILALVIATNIARLSRSPDLKILVAAQYFGGGLYMYAFNCTSIPLCLVGFGFGIVGLIAHKNHYHLFTWIGLLINGSVILFVIGLYLAVVSLS